MIGTRLLLITWLTKNTFSKRTPFLLLYSLFSIPKSYLLPAKRKVSYMTGKLSMSVLHWIFSNHLHSYCIHCKRRGMQQCHVFLNCCHVEKMTHYFEQWSPAILSYLATTYYSISSVNTTLVFSGLKLDSVVNTPLLYIFLAALAVPLYLLRKE